MACSFDNCDGCYCAVVLPPCNHCIEHLCEHAEDKNDCLICNWEGTDTPYCYPCKKEAVQRDAGFTNPAPYWMCPDCKKEILIQGHTAKEIQEMDPNDFYAPPILDLDDDDDSSKLVLRTRISRPTNLETLYDKKNEALEILTKELGVEYNKATKIIYNFFEEEGWHDSWSVPNDADVGRGSFGRRPVQKRSRRKKSPLK